MTTSTAPLTPEVEAQIFARVAREDYQRWAQMVDRCGGCSRPVRLKGRIVERSRNGDLITYSTANEPDGVLLIRCGNRRAAVCPSCAFEYAGDVWHLVVAGINGDHKGVPAHVADHPKAFASITGPSFGPVHSTPTGKNGKRGHCRPRSTKALCPHGRPTWCMHRHGDDDPRLGEPLCGDCYDYRGAAAFNWHAPELWRRFTIALARELARLAGLSERAASRLVKAQYAKVAELQRRAVVHFHAIIRLDGKARRDDAEHWPAPAPVFTAAMLDAAIRTAAAHVCLTVDVGDGTALVLRFGTQIDIQALTHRQDLDSGEIAPEHVAAYVAKYATKAAEDLGLGERRQVPDLYHARQRNLSAHVLRLLEAAWELGDLEAFTGIRRWLHMLAFRGHFSSKTRRYSTTLGALRAERRRYREDQDRERRAQADPAGPVQLVDVGDQDDDPDSDDTTLVIRTWTFAGLGWDTAGDAALAASTAARAREHRELAAEFRRTGVA
jgi:hypothetical protein